ncbi:MAG: TRAP transporter substrate-binding protein DctP [Spirochaetaceae bacterium]|jgi:TRAP-type C4-dicarboxylate transport system substrate-binding protein|nr:TRAP transporter substrate-binding protein DctP [Spirochaetaceae bacterium]
MMKKKNAPKGERAGRSLFLPLLAVLAALAFFFGAGEAQAQRRRVILKIASVAPEATPYGEALNRMSNEWRRITNGEVELRIYHNGILGQEEDLLRKLRLNEIQGAVLTSFGLNLITPEILTLSCPFFIRDDGELAYVLENIKTDLEARIEEQGFRCLAWANAGWIRIFSRRPVFVPDDLKRQKVASDPSELRLLQVFKTMGYQVVPLGQNDLMMGLSSGMIDALYSSPIAVGGLQLFAVARNMATINIAPFMGGIVLNRQAWRQIPEQYREALIRVNRQIEQSMSDSILRLESDALEAMVQHGLVINRLSPEQDQLWYDDVTAALPSLIGQTFDRDTLNRVDALLRGYRSRGQ